MINKRLIETVSESKRYIAGNVLMQWISLLGNLVMMTTIANLLEGLYQRNANRQVLVGWCPFWQQCWQCGICAQ